MVRTRSVTHVALYDSAYIILFDDGSFSSHGLSKNLKRELNRNKSLEIEFISLGPDEQWFFRLTNGQVCYDIEDKYLVNKLKYLRAHPYKLWFNNYGGYILQYDNSRLNWHSIPQDLRHLLKDCQQSLLNVKDITFGAYNTWWASFEDGNCCCSPDIPWNISKHLTKIELLVLDPANPANYFLTKNDGSLRWNVNEHFHDIMNKSDHIIYLNPHDIRYTQTSISCCFSNGQSIETLREDLENNVVSIHDIPIIHVVQTKSGNYWSLNNRRLWCFRHAHNIKKIPVNIVDKRPIWFHQQIQNLRNPFDIYVRTPSYELKSLSYSNDDYDYDSDVYVDY